MDEKIKILILDDDKDEWEIIKPVLERNNQYAYFYEKSAEMLEDICPDGQVIAIDYRLGMDSGYKVMVRAKEICPLCYFILMTGQMIGEEEEKMINAISDFFILKTPDYPYKLAVAINDGQTEVIHRREQWKLREVIFEKAEDISKSIEKLNKHEPGPGDGTI
jgi:DNA-binding NtrC family response regulator